MKGHLFLLLMFAVTAVGHTQQEHPDGAAQPAYGQQYQRSTSPGAGRTKPDWNGLPDVFPGTEQQPDTDEVQPKTRKHNVVGHRSFGDSIGSSINTNDTDYGGLLALWRLHIVDDTILKAEFWGVVCSGFTILLLLFYIYWLQEQRAERFRVTLDIVHQLRNSCSYARFYANRVIRIHNELVRGLNDEYEKKWRSGEAADGEEGAFQTSAITAIASQSDSPDLSYVSVDGAGVRDEAAASGTKKGSIPQLDAMEFRASLELSGPLGGTKSAVSESLADILAKANASASASQIVELSNEDQEDKDALIRRLQAQVEAKDQRHRSLRNSFNRLKAEASGNSNPELDGAE